MNYLEKTNVPAPEDSPMSKDTADFMNIEVNLEKTLADQKHHLLTQLLEVVEGKKKDEYWNSGIRSFARMNYNTALDDIKQEITKLLEQ